MCDLNTVDKQALVSSLLSELKRCSAAKDLKRGIHLHSQASSWKIISHRYVANSLINMYSKCGRMADAKRVFDEFGDSGDIISWHVLITGYVDNGESKKALQVFDSMKTTRGACSPDERIYVAVISACAAMGSDGSKSWIEKGKSIHFEAVTSRCCNVFVENSLIGMYAQYGQMLYARTVFESMQNPDVVSWNALIQGYSDNGEPEMSLKLFDSLLREPLVTPNARTYVAALSACSGLAMKARDPEEKAQCFQRGKEIHSRAVINRCCSMFVESTVIDMYAKCGRMIESKIVFDKMPQRDVVAWTSLIMGYVENRDNECALEHFMAMKAAGVQPNSTTYVAALMACGNLMAEEFGRTIHSNAQSYGCLRDVKVANCLIDFYGKCGSMQSAKQVFDSLKHKTVVSWNSLMHGYSMQGDPEYAFVLFDKMRELGFSPNEVTFVCLLTACSHAGLTHKGNEYFSIMSCAYGITPNIKHYACVIDLLGRANCLDEALKAVESMPFEADAVIWRAILGACHKWRNSRVGRVAYDALVKLGHGDDSSIYALFSTICADTEAKHSQRTLGQTCWTDDTGAVRKFTGLSK